jgi:hypothetical protein
MLLRVSKHATSSAYRLDLLIQPCFCPDRKTYHEIGKCFCNDVIQGEAVERLESGRCQLENPLSVRKLTSINVCLPCSRQEVQLAQDCSRPRVASVVRHIHPDHACRIAPDIWADRPTNLAVAVSHALEYRPLGVFQRPLDSRANIIHDLSRPPGRDVTRSVFENTGSRQ